MPSFLESVSNAAAGRDEKQAKEKKKNDDGKGLNFQQRLQSLLGGPKPKNK